MLVAHKEADGDPVELMEPEMLAEADVEPVPEDAIVTDSTSEKTPLKELDTDGELALLGESSGEFDKDGELEPLGERPGDLDTDAELVLLVDGPGELDTDAELVLLVEGPGVLENDASALSEPELNAVLLIDSTTLRVAVAANVGVTLRDDTRLNVARCVPSIEFRGDALRPVTDALRDANPEGSVGVTVLQGDTDEDAEVQLKADALTRTDLEGELATDADVDSDVDAEGKLVTEADAERDANAEGELVTEADATRDANADGELATEAGAESDLREEGEGLCVSLFAAQNAPKLAVARCVPAME